MNLKLVCSSIAVALIVCAYLYGRSDGRNLERKDALEAAQIKIEKAREETERRLVEKEKIANDAKAERELAQADARAARNVSDRLRDRINDLTRSANHPATIDGSAATCGTGILLANVFSRTDERAGELAEYADRARIAGQACERQYDSLINAEIETDNL